MAVIPIEIDVIEDKAIQSTDAFGSSLGGVVGRLQQMTRAALAFIATPIGAIIAALTLALGALTSFFKRSEEGQNALNKVTRIFASILDNILDVVDKVGKAIFEFVTSPIEGIKNLGNAIITFIQDPIQGTIDLINEAKKAAIDFVEDIKRDIVLSKLLANAEAELDLVQRKFEVEGAKRQARIEELRLKAREDLRFDAETRKGFLEEASVLINKQIEEETRLAKSRAVIAKVGIQLANSDKEALDAEAKTIAELSQLEAKRFRELRTLQRDFLRLNNEIARERQKSLQEETRSIEDFNKEIEELEEERADRRRQRNKEVVIDIRKIADASVERLAKEKEQFDKRQGFAALEKQTRLDTVNAIADATAAGAKLLGEQTIAGIALGVATATADTFVAANKTLAAFPGPVGIALAAVIIATGLANVAQIVKAGKSAGAIVGGGGGGGAQVATVATSAVNFPTVSTGIAQQQQIVNINSNISVQEIDDVKDRVTAKEVETTLG